MLLFSIVLQEFPLKLKLYERGRKLLQNPELVCFIIYCFLGVNLSFLLSDENKLPKAQHFEFESS